MAYNYLGLVNDLNHRLNEVELTSSNFATASGYYALAKDAVNASIRFINQDKFTWPFNFSAQEDTLVAGTMRYSLPADCKFADFNTFRIKRNDTFGNSTEKLELMDYEEYLEKYVDDEYNTSTGIRTIPRRIIRTPDQKYIVHPSPDQAYELVYEYYTLPTDLSAYDDVPSIPVSFRYIIGDGAMYYLYKFRGDEQSAQQELEQLSNKLKDMRSIYINRYEYVRDTRIGRT